MDRKKFALTLAVFLCVCNYSSLLFADIQRVSGVEGALAGLTTVYPRVQYYEDGALQETNSDKIQLQSEVESKLIDAGFKLVGAEEFHRLVASVNYPIAMLDMEIRMSKIPDLELRAYVVSIKVKQAVFLSRKPVIRFMAPTWESMDFGAAKDFPFVGSVAKDAFGRFVQDLQAQNPK
jgi:hypothetical protein